MNLPTQRYILDLRKYYRLPSVQVSLTLVLSVFLIAIFITFALRPTIVSIVSLRKTITESEKTLEILDKKVSSLEKAATQLETVKSFLPILDINIPNTGAEYSPLNLAIEALARQTGTQLENESLGATLLFSRILSPFTPSRSQSVVELPFSLRVTGSYPSVAEFLKKLLSMERVVMVESITITRETEKKSENTGVALNVSGSAYYLADEVQLKKAMPETKGNK